MDRETVPQRTPERRVIAIRRNVLGKNTSVGFFERNGFPPSSIRQQPDSLDDNSSSFIKLECWTFGR
jgi:hypothetical protein